MPKLQDLNEQNLRNLIEIQLHDVWIRSSAFLHKHELAHVVDEPQLRKYLGYKVETLVMFLSGHIHGGCRQEVHFYFRHPADWWEAFKERWFPAWLLRRYPVKYEEKMETDTYYAKVCPHDLKTKSGIHVAWSGLPDEDLVHHPHIKDPEEYARRQAEESRVRTPDEA